MSMIFVSYRQTDSAYVAAAINDKLEKHFGEDSVFFDIDSIPLGTDFRSHIADAVGRCDVLLAVIGDDWVDAVDENGSRRLENPADFVRLELEAALERGIPVVPVLVGGASIPSSASLPPSLQDLAFRNAAEVRAGRDLQQHLARLVVGVEATLEASTPPGESRTQGVDQAPSDTADPATIESQADEEGEGPQQEAAKPETSESEPTRPERSQHKTAGPTLPHQEEAAPPPPSVADAANSETEKRTRARKVLVLVLVGFLVSVVLAGRWYLEEIRAAAALGYPKMIPIPVGRFTMGSLKDESGRNSSEGPTHPVDVRAFEIGKTEVTFAQWDACVADGGCSHEPSDEGWGGGERPVINVSWNDAAEYTRWLSKKTGDSYRLPSEAEWEYAARAGTTTPFHFGETINMDQVNHNGNYPYVVGPGGKYRKQTVPAGSLPANEFGLHEVHGNVWEWVEDCWHGSYDGAPGSGSAWVDGCPNTARVLRGGSWSNHAEHTRSANRDRDDPGYRNYFIGFRVARTLP